MALTIRMRIDDNDEHKYYYATGSGTEIELIPLVVDSNGDYVPDEGKAYNRVTVNVPSTELETLIVNTNGTYNAPDGKAYNVVQVDVKSIINLQNKSASYTENGNYNIQADSGYDGLGTVSVAVNVPTPTPELQSKTETYTENGSYTVRPDSGYDGLSGVDVEVNVPATPTPSIQASKSQTITQNGTVTVSPDSGYDAMEEAEITVNVPTGGNVQDYKSVSYTQNGFFEVTPDSGYDGIARVGIGISVPTGGGGGVQIATGTITTGSSGDFSEDVGLPSNITVRGFYLITGSYENGFVLCLSTFPRADSKFMYTCFYEYTRSSGGRYYDRTNLNVYPTSLGNYEKTAFISETDGMLKYRCGSSSTLIGNATYNYVVVYEEN